MDVVMNQRGEKKMQVSQSPKSIIKNSKQAVMFSR